MLPKSAYVAGAATGAVAGWAVARSGGATEILSPKIEMGYGAAFGSLMVLEIDAATQDWRSATPAKAVDCFMTNKK
jgi:hypothetical protein